MAETKEKSLEQMQREITETDLETKRLQLAEAKSRNAHFAQTEETRRKTNQQRQEEFKHTAASTRATQKDCRHKSGGSPTNIHKGGGKFSFSLLTRTIMPDGKTELIQCQRCFLKLYGRERTGAEIAKLKALDAADEKKGGTATRYEDHLWWVKLRETSIEDGIPDNVMRGPTFTFQNAEGVNFIPELV